MYNFTLMPNEQRRIYSETCLRINQGGGLYYYQL